MRWFKRKKTPTVLPKTKQQPNNMAMAQASGEMSSSLSADILRPEAQSLLQSLKDQISNQGISSSSNLSDAVQGNKPISDEMKKLLNKLSVKLFPHRHKKDSQSVDTKALMASLREQLEKAPVKPIEAPKIEVTGDTPMGQSEFAASEEPQSKMSSGLGGETKPEHATAEALANPFSLVNINRGAASGQSISPGMDTSNDGMDGKIKATQRETSKNERTTVTYKKKLQQLKFSRRRFLRDYNGTNILNVIFLFIIFIGSSAGTIVTNVSFLIPQTQMNQEAGQQAVAFRNQIDRDTPKLSGLLNQRKNFQVKVDEALNNFASTTDIRNSFSSFITELDDDPRVEVSEQTIDAEENELPRVENITVSFKVKTNFLLWLQYRNRFIRNTDEINVIEETITAPAGEVTVDIFIKMSRPGRTT